MTLSKSVCSSTVNASRDPSGGTTQLGPFFEQRITTCPKRDQGLIYADGKKLRPLVGLVFWSAGVRNGFHPRAVLYGRRVHGTGASTKTGADSPTSTLDG